MRNAPSWIVCYMAVLKAGAVAVLVNGWWQADELRHALELTEPKLVIADTPRAQRIEATGLDLQTVTLPIERPLHDALAPVLDEGNGEGALPQVKHEAEATTLLTSGSLAHRSEWGEERGGED